MLRCCPKWEMRSCRYAEFRRFWAAPLVSLPYREIFSARNLFEDKDLQTRLAADPLRPQCHLLPAKNWMNDPNGPILWNGLYHMFFQYNPNAAVWGDMHWARFRSSSQ